MLKTCSKHLFGNLEVVNFISLKIHMHDQIVDEISKFRDLSHLDAYLYKHFNATIKKFIRMALMR